MSLNKAFIPVALTTALTSGCAMYTGPSSNDPLSQACHEAARRTAGGFGETAKIGGIGALGGGGLGAVIGEVTKESPGAGAALGAAVGGIGGGLYQANKQNEVYTNTFNNCMRNPDLYLRWGGQPTYPQQQQPAPYAPRR